MENADAPFPPILHRDDRLIVLNKPHGLLSVPGIGAGKQDCLASRVQRHHPEARIVHRLDRDTSGVIVMAFDAEAHRELSRQFHDREVEKRYTAIVAGHVRTDAGRIDLPIRKDMDPANKPRQLIDHDDGRPSITDYTVIERLDNPQRTRLDLKPITGRSHQLRLHLKEIGHPILGDDLYAPAEVLVLSDRLLLHARTLWLVHPGTAAPMRWEAPCPF